MKFKILRDYYTSGYFFEEGIFDTIDEAIKHAVITSCTPFIIVSVHWEPEFKKVN